MEKPMNHASELRKAYAEKAALEEAASPSSPNYGDYTDEYWLEMYNYYKGVIYSLEESLASFDQYPD
jgi:hypothetical protein